MLEDLDFTLKELLNRRLPQEVLGILARDAPITFTTPNVETSPPQPFINFLLYDVRENLELRSSVGVMGRQNPAMITQIPPPVFVDCSYFVTVWLHTPPEVLDREHWILGEVMKVLLRYPKIPPTFLQGQLAQQDQPIKAAALRPGQLQNMGELWQSIGSKPKTALHYTVTVAVPVHDPVDVGPPVTEKIVGIKTGTDIPIERLQPY